MDPRYRILLRVGWGSLILFLSLVIFIVISDWDGVKSSNRKGKRIEIDGATIYGYDRGKKSWEITSSYIWAGRSQFLFRLDDVIDGCLYDRSGRKVLDHLNAKSIKVNSKNQTLSAEQDVTAVLVGRQDILQKIQPGESESDVLISSQRFKYFHSSQKAYLSGDVELRQGNAHIFVENEVMYDVSRNVAVVEGGVFYETSEFCVTANRMVIFLDEEYAVFEGNIQGERLRLAREYEDDRENHLQSEPLYLTSDKLTYRTVSGDIQLIIEGNVVLKQSDKWIQGEWAFYDRESQFFEMRGAVVFWSNSIEWLIDRERKAEFLNLDFNEVIAQPVTVNCRSAVFKSEEKHLELLGPLTVEQKELNLSASRLLYDDLTGVLSFHGRVVVDRLFSDQLKSSFLSIHVFDERVFAEKDIQVEFEWEETIVTEDQ